MIKLYHRKNEIAIDLTGVENPAVISFSYTGKMYAESQLPSDWFVASNQNKVMCVSLGNSVPELLFNYVGLINIRVGSVIDRDLNKHYINTIVEDIDYWDNMTVDFDKNTQYWEGLGSTHELDRNIRRSSIVSNNLLTNPDEFYFADGTPYQGDYHQHGDGQAMTGSEHSEESEYIYRKDANGNIFDSRKKMSKAEAKRLISHYKPIIPSIRRYTKSETHTAKELKKQAGFSKKRIDTPRVQTTVKTIKGY